METDFRIEFTLNENEFSALKTVLGKHTDIQYKDYGLTDTQISAMHELWSLIPYSDDE